MGKRTNRIVITSYSIHYTKLYEMDPIDVERAVRPTTILITVMHANNEVGTVQPIAEISRIAKKHGIVMHTDAAQSAGKIPTDVEQFRITSYNVCYTKLLLMNRLKS